MNYLPEEQNMIYNEEKFDKSLKTLLMHSKNKTRFKKNAFLVSTGGVDSSDYTGKSLRRSNFSQKNFYGTIFNNSGAAGTHFSYCHFHKCQFKYTNMQECTFYGGIIKDNTKENSIISSNFNQSLFTNHFEIVRCFFEHCVFHGTAFIDCIIKNTTFFSSTLEDTLFSNVYMENVNFSDLNIDFSVFQNTKMHQVVLPFSQICFSFGLLPYLMNTKDEIYVTSSHSDCGYISKDEYLQLIPDFMQYYSGTKDYFPLANIYLALEKNDQAREAIKRGLLIAITNYDFMRIKYLCKLIYSYPVFSYHERKLFYDFINSKISFSNTDARLQYNYSVYRNEINNYLLNNNKRQILTSEINIITKISYDNSILLGNLLSIIENIIEYRKSLEGEHSVSVRHNSNIEIGVFLQDFYQALTVIVPSIYSILLGIEILNEKRIANKHAKKELQYEEALKALEVENAQVELERNKIALKKEQLELQNQLTLSVPHNQETLRQNVLDLGIEVSEISHITYGNIPPDVNENIIQFSSR